MSRATIARSALAGVLALAMLVGCPPELKDPRARVPKGGYRLSHRDIEVAVDARLRLALARVLPKAAGEARGKRVELVRASTSLYAVRMAGALHDAFVVDPAQTTVVELKDALGAGRRFTLVVRELLAAREPSAGKAAAASQAATSQAATQGPLELTVELTSYQRYPGTLFTRATLKNHGKTPLLIEAVLGPRVVLPPSAEARWAFQGAAIAWGKDTVFELKRGYSSVNAMGWKAGLGGGGLPINDVWSRRGGVALGHYEVGPRHVQLPLAVNAQGAVSLALRERGGTLAPGATRVTARGFITVHGGDFYRPVSEYRQMLGDQILGDRGAKLPKPPRSAYQPIWCSWGYGFDVRPEEIIAILPKLKALGIRWVVLDDRWFDAYGDWHPRKEQFGAHGEQMKKLVKAIHAQGMYAKLWWIPLVAEISGAHYESHVYQTAKVVQRHPDWLIKDEGGKPLRGIRKLAYLDPTKPGVRAYNKRLVERFIRDWDFDGHKLDVVFAHPPRGGDRDPERSSRAMVAAYRDIYELTAKLKPHAVTEICPCGTMPYHAWLPFMNQAVTADPVGALQMRRRIKLLKALFGPRYAVYADHVELSRIEKNREIGEDFASALGTGAVIGTKFVWPKPSRALSAGADRFLDPRKEAHWKRWIALARKKDLARGRYEGALYDLAFDRPETHVVQRGGTWYYAFYAATAKGTFEGKVTFRGPLKTQREVWDYVTGKRLGHVGPNRRTLDVTFTGALLVELR